MIGEFVKAVVMLKDGAPQPSQASDTLQGFRV